MVKPSFRKDTSGQVIIVSALLIAMLLLSTALYVVETTKHVPTVENNVATWFVEYKQAAKSTLISALANITAGGDTGILEEDFSQLKYSLQAQSYSSILNFAYTPLNSGLYQNGVSISWGNTGVGISSAYVDFGVDSSSASSTANLQYNVNVTSQVTFNGNFIQENDTKIVNLSISLRNEDKPALANGLTFQYQNGSNLVTVENPEIVSHNDGSYTASFIVPSPAELNSLTVSIVCMDQRGIFTGANYTCTS